MSYKKLLLLFVIIGLLAFFIYNSFEVSSVPVMRIGANNWPGYQPLFLSRHLNYIKDNEFRLVEHSSASQVLRSLRNETLDAGALTMDEALLLLSQGKNIKVVLVLDISNGADVIISQPGIKSMTELKGKRIGVEKTALGSYMLTRALEINGLSLNDVIAVPIELGAHEKSFLDKTVDAVITFEPVRSKLLRNKGNIIFDSSKIPNEIVDVLVVSYDYYNAYPDRIDKLKDSWFKSLEQLQNNLKEHSHFLELQMKLKEDEIKSAYLGLTMPSQKENDAFLEGNGESSLFKSTTKLYEIMKKNQIINSDVQVEDLFN